MAAANGRRRGMASPEPRPALGSGLRPGGRGRVPYPPMSNRSTETLWAPWRLGYVQGHDKGPPAEPVTPSRWRDGASHDCFLCLGVVARTPSSVIVTNRFPYSNGHLLVAPLDHRATLAELSTDQLLDLQICIVRWCGVMERSMQAHGFNIGLNHGAVAGAGLPGHPHWHVVPRWPGDVNFLPTVAGVRVLPQSLEALREQLVRAAAAIQADNRPDGSRS
jgi:ATP adenylyltransferase